MALALVLAACGSSAGNKPPPPPPCDQKCADDIALRAYREMIKLAYNITLQGKPVGAQDATKPCPQGGTVHVFGTATSNAVQGATEVNLTYVFDACGYQRQDTDPDQNYAITLTGTTTETGTIAIQPSSTTSLVLHSDAMTFAGTVHDPPADYRENACALALGQDGNQLSGKICGRDAGLTL
jgi:hypothetical protein